jgi:glutamyl-tRNA synthetase
MGPRVRFCPSPTGMFHVGGARTALFNWLYARQHGGTYLLRIEDTDDARNRPEWTQMIYDTLGWLGLDWDETYFQSAHFDHHREVAEELFAAGHAYWCECTADDLKERQGKDAQKGYDRYCRDRGLEQGPGRALRFRVRDGSLVRSDVVRGTAEIDCSTIEDFVIMRASGVPLYVFANCLDDVLDGITHVIRGDDHLSNVPKQMLIREARGLDQPVWCHVPLIVNEKRQKLSKRRDKVALDLYQQDGYLAEALVNYLGTLGWSPPGGSEIVPLEQMVRDFRLEDIVSSAAQFDEKKLAAFNGEYIRALAVGDFVARSRPWLEERGFAGEDVFEQMAAVVQERVQLLSEVPEMVDFLFVDQPVIDEAAWQKPCSTSTALASGPPAPSKR